MKKQEKLVIDFSQENAVLQVFPDDSPIVTRRTAQWHNIRVEYVHQLPCEVIEHSIRQHTLVVQLTQAFGSERRLDTYHQHEDLKAGNIAVIPANVIHWCADRQQAEFLLLTLEPGFVSHIAHESVNPEQLEILPQFAQTDRLIYGIGLSLQAEMESQGVGSGIYVDSLCNTLAMHLLKRYASRQDCIREYFDGLPKYKLRQVIDYINAHLSEDINLAALAELVGMSQYYFCQLFKQSIGMAPYQYVIQQRLERAKQLLQQREATISDIALQCGFANQSHFTKHFRKLTGITPKAYRDR